MEWLGTRGYGFIPATPVEGGSSPRLGGPKYAKFEIARGRPLPIAESR